MNKLKPPVIISFMGVDGSGKTTLAKKINKIFKKSRYLHLKPYILFKDRRTTVKNPHIYKKNIFFISLIRLISWLVSYKFFFLNIKILNFIFSIGMHMISLLIHCDIDTVSQKI